MVELVSLIGRLHRVFRYEAFVSPTEAHNAIAARSANPAWKDFVTDHAEWVADEDVVLLKSRHPYRTPPLSLRRSSLPERTHR